MSNEERRRSSRISELEARNALRRSQKQSRMTLGRKDEQSDRKGARKKVKTRPLQDLISDPAEQQAHVLEPQIKKLERPEENICRASRPYAGERGKRNEDSADQRRQTYQPPGKGKSLASDDPEDMTTLVQAKKELDYKGSVMRFIEDLGPTVKFIATRTLCQNLPHGSVPENEVPHLQTQAVTLDASNVSQDSFHQVAAARSVHQGSVHQKAVPALTDFSYRNPTKPPHLNLPAKSSNFYGGNALAIGGMNRSEDPSFIIPEARHTLAYPTHQTGQETNYINKGLDIANDSERDMTAGILYSSSFYQPAATTLNGNPNPFATWNFAPDSQGSNFSKMMQDAMMTDGLAKKGETVSSYPAMQATAAKGKSPLLPSWQEPSQGAISFPRNDYKDLDWTLQAAPIPEESSLPVGQRSNCLNPTNEGISTGAGRLPHWLSPTDGGNSTGAGQLPHWLSPANDGISTGAGPLPHWLSPSKESSSLGAGPVLNWLSLSHGGGSDHAPNCANPVTSKPQFFEFLCPPQSRPAGADVMGQARIPNQQDQVPLHDARLGSAFDVQDAGTRDRKGKSVMENEAAIHHPSSSSNVRKWFLG
ncbi:hypothetical protein ACJRO7_018133 [Eucalyptus globulus]|uniref:Uncharacterized protein n=1 Tax=Eucalyptus globulus TaxID=34317 RepID=A0ABD3KZC0_EUCGL